MVLTQSHRARLLISDMERMSKEMLNAAGRTSSLLSEVSQLRRDALAMARLIITEQLDQALPSVIDRYRDEIADEDEAAKEPTICSNCNGSGEGQYEGAACRYCKGRGVIDTNEKD